MTDFAQAIIMASVCLSLLAALGGVFFLSRRHFRGVTAATRQVEEAFGLMNHKPKGLYPDLRGKVDGIEVAVDVIYESYATSGKRGQRPWTRVRAQLPAAPKIQVRARHQRLGEKPEWPARKTGDAAFDDKYELFAPPDLALDEALKPAVKEALLAANPPVHILNNVALWTKIRSVRDPELLKNAVLSCVQVAVAFGDFPTD